jgi:hypothetical protein
MGCCLFAIILAGAPRFALLVWYLFQPLRVQAGFPNWFVPLAGFLFLPWTTLMYVFVYPGGLNWFDWVLLILALLVDLSSYGGGARARQMRRSES